MANTSDIALSGLLRILDSMLSSVENLGIQNDIQRELARLVSQVDPEVVNLNQLRQEYFNIAQRYLSLKQPFHWNIVGYDNSVNGGRDINQYLELIEFSAFLGSYDLLQMYGFDCLSDFGGDCILGQDYSFYCDSFYFLLENKAQSETKPYFQYVLDQFNALCR